jgi:NADH-quinone oxidoreductase subunit J
MSFFDVVFYLFATITMLAGMGVVLARNPVHAALFLVLAFCSAAGIWMLLEAEFLAIALILVYVGAVMVLFLFVVMMLDINLVKLREGFWRWFPFGALLAGLMVFEMIWVLGSPQLSDVSSAIVHGADYSNTRELGRVLYTQYVYPFELAAVILLVAMVAAIALTLRRRTNVKKQNISEQVKVKKADRLRIVKMQSETKA